MNADKLTTGAGLSDAGINTGTGLAGQTLGQGHPKQGTLTHSQHTLPLLQAFYLNPHASELGPAPETPSELIQLNQEVKNGKSLREAFASLNPHDQKRLRGKIGEDRLDTLFSISENRRTPRFWQEIMGFTQDLKRSFKTKDLLMASMIYGEIAKGEREISEEIQREAQLEHKALIGDSSDYRRREVLLGRGLGTVTDMRIAAPAVIAPMLGQAVNSYFKGVQAFSRGAMGMRWFNAGLTGRTLSGAGSFALETFAFAQGGRLLFDLTEGGVPWGPEDMILSTYGAGITLLGLKGFGFLGNQLYARAFRISELITGRGLGSLSQAAIQQTSGYLGLVGVHHIEERAGLISQMPNGNPWLDALETHGVLFFGTGGAKTFLGPRLWIRNHQYGLQGEMYYRGDLTPRKTRPTKWFQQIKERTLAKLPSFAKQTTPDGQEFWTIVPPEKKSSLKNSGTQIYKVEGDDSGSGSGSSVSQELPAVLDPRNSSIPPKPNEIGTQPSLTNPSVLDAARLIETLGVPRGIKNLKPGETESHMDFYEMVGKLSGEEVLPLALMVENNYRHPDWQKRYGAAFAMTQLLARIPQNKRWNRIENLLPLLVEDRPEERSGSAKIRTLASSTLALGSLHLAQEEINRLSGRVNQLMEEGGYRYLFLDAFTLQINLLKIIGPGERPAALRHITEWRLRNGKPHEVEHDLTLLLDLLEPGHRPGFALWFQKRVDSIVTADFSVMDQRGRLVEIAAALVEKYPEPPTPSVPPAEEATKAPENPSGKESSESAPSSKPSIQKAARLIEQLGYKDYEAGKPVDPKDPQIEFSKITSGLSSEENLPLAELLEKYYLHPEWERRYGAVFAIIPLLGHLKFDARWPRVEKLVPLLAENLEKDLPGAKQPRKSSKVREITAEALFQSVVFLRNLSGGGRGEFIQLRDSIGQLMVEQKFAPHMKEAQEVMTHLLKHLNPNDRLPAFQYIFEWRFRNTGPGEWEKDYYRLQGYLEPKDKERFNRWLNIKEEAIRAQKEGDENKYEELSMAASEVLAGSIPPKSDDLPDSQLPSTLDAKEKSTVAVPEGDPKRQNTPVTPIQFPGASNEDIDIHNRKTPVPPPFPSTTRETPEAKAEGSLDPIPPPETKLETPEAKAGELGSSGINSDPANPPTTRLESPEARRRASELPPLAPRITETTIPGKDGAGKPPSGPGAAEKPPSSPSAVGRPPSSPRSSSRPQLSRSAREWNVARPTDWIGPFSPEGEGERYVGEGKISAAVNREYGKLAGIQVLTEAGYVPTTFPYLAAAPAIFNIFQPYMMADPNTVIFVARSEVNFNKAIRENQEVRIRVTPDIPVGRFQKRQMSTVKVEIFETGSEEGRPPLAQSEITFLIQSFLKKPWNDLKNPVRRRLPLQDLQRLSGKPVLVRQISGDDITAYGQITGAFYPAVMDDFSAQARGIPGKIADIMMIQEAATRALFLADPVRNPSQPPKYETEYIKWVRPGDTLRFDVQPFEAKVKEKGRKMLGPRIGTRVTVLNQFDEVVLRMFDETPRGHSLENIPRKAPEPRSPALPVPLSPMEITYGRFSVTLNVQQGLDTAMALERSLPAEMVREGREIAEARRNRKELNPKIILGASGGFGFPNAMVSAVTGMHSGLILVGFELPAALRRKFPVSLKRLALLEGIKLYAQEKRYPVWILNEDLVLTEGTPEEAKPVPERLWEHLRQAQSSDLAQNPHPDLFNGIAFGRRMCPHPLEERQLAVPDITVEGLVRLRDMYKYQEKDYWETVGIMGHNHRAILNAFWKEFGPNSVTEYPTFSPGSRLYSLGTGNYAETSVGHGKWVGENHALEAHQQSMREGFAHGKHLVTPYPATETDALDGLNGARFIAVNTRMHLQRLSLYRSIGEMALRALSDIHGGKIQWMNPRAEVPLDAAANAIMEKFVLPDLKEFLRRKAGEREAYEKRYPDWKYEDPENNNKIETFDGVTSRRILQRLIPEADWEKIPNKTREEMSKGESKK